MKIILLGDTHFDEKNGDQKLLDMQMSFLKQQMIPYMLENNISTIAQLGDITNNRTHISLNTQHEIFNLLTMTHEAGLNWIYLIGNHDIFFKDSRDIFSMEVIEKAFDNFRVVKTVEVIEGLQFTPWMCSDEKFEILPGAKAILGHFDIKDFYVTKTFKSEHGLGSSAFKSMPVYSGHYHLKQDVGNIHFVGTPYQLDWNDFNTLKGFHVLDTETLECKFIENEKTPKHIKIYLDVDTKVCTLEGFVAMPQQLPVDALIKSGIFGTHKIKVFAKKELAVTKKLVEFLEASGHVVKLEIIPETEEVDIEQRIEKVKSMSISESIMQIVDDPDKQLTADIVASAKTAMVKERGGE